MIAGIYHEEICLKARVWGWFVGLVFSFGLKYFFPPKMNLFFFFFPLLFFCSSFVPLRCFCTRAATICIRERQEILFGLVGGAFISFMFLQENSSLPDYSYLDVFKCRLTSKGFVVVV